MSGFPVFSSHSHVGRGRSKRGFFLLVSTVSLHLKTRLICLSSKSFPALSSLQEQGFPLFSGCSAPLPWGLRLGGGKTSVLTPSSAVSLFFYPLGAAPEGLTDGQTFLSQLQKRTEEVKI